MAASFPVWLMELLSEPRSWEWLMADARRTSEATAVLRAQAIFNAQEDGWVTVDGDEPHTVRRTAAAEARLRGLVGQAR